MDKEFFSNQERPQRLGIQPERYSLGTGGDNPMKISVYFRGW